jgi:MFS superfamily sulfate permease-like transporter
VKKDGENFVVVAVVVVFFLVFQLILIEIIINTVEIIKKIIRLFIETQRTKETTTRRYVVLNFYT